jgi:hypothetical protein
MISGFHGEVDENCTLLGCFAASNVNFSPTFWNSLSVSSSSSSSSPPPPPPPPLSSSSSSSSSSS